MTEDRKLENSVDFVARHYRRDAFSAKDGWRRLGLTSRVWWHTRWAAACAVTVALAASAGVYVWMSGDAPEVSTTPVVEAPTTQQPTEPKSCRIEFNDAPLDRVVKEIEEVYGVKVINQPADSDGYRLTLGYEGTARDLVAAINDLLDINMEVEE